MLLGVRGWPRPRYLLLLATLAAMLFVVPSAVAATFTVTKTTDTNDGVCNSDCSLREAISAANANPGADTVSVPGGTYQLTLANAGGANEDANATGDLDILGPLTLSGAGSGSTIIEAGTDTTNGIDKVIAINPICVTGFDATITGVTVRYGRNTQPITDPAFSYTGGGIDWCTAGTGGTFTLSNSVISDNTNVNGYGGGLNVDTVSSPTTVHITNDTFQNNKTLTAVNTGTGGAINLFGDSPTVDVTNSTFSGNSTANATSGGGAIYFRPTTIGSLSISGSTFSSNTAGGIGGAIATDAHGAGTTVDIQTSTFTGNTATNSFGGALDLDATNRNTTPFSLSHLTITGNSAGQAGGGLYVGNSNVALSKSVIVGNSAPSGSGIRKSVDASTATVTDNWWGCSTGPGAAPCDTATTAGGTLAFTPWYRDQLTATTSPLQVNQSTSLTASFRTDSSGTAVPAADLSEIIGRSVTWAATGGNLSSTQSTIQSTGTATGSFQASAVGTAIVSAKVDADNTAPVSSNVLSLTVNKADTTTTIDSDTPDPTVTGQPYTVSYNVAGSHGNSPTAPTGNVIVSDGTDTCTGSAAAGQCTLTSTTSGAKTLTATYQGDSNFNASPGSSGVAHQVNKADTTTSISSDSPDPSVVGQTVTVHYGVAVSSPGSGSPTGNVTVSDGTQSCTGTVAAGQCSITFTSAGARSLTATYAGDANFNGSDSATEGHTVNKADTTTAISSDNPDPSNIGQAVTVNYSVAPVAPGGGTPTGTVTVSDGVDSCTGTVAAGTCNITLSTGGGRTLTASYAGNSNFNGSASAGESHTVNKVSTATSITSDSPDPSVVGQSVTVHYSVSPSGGGTPTGTVTVSDGVIFCTGTVAAGQCTLTFTGVGARSLTASYAGDATFNGSDSVTESHAVNQADTTTSITSDSPDPSVVGQSVMVGFTVAAASPGAGTPTGNVTVSDGTQSCTALATDGQCTITFSSAGAKSLSASYAGDANFNASSSSPATAHTVNTAGTITSITSDTPDPSTVGQSVTVAYSVTAAVGTPTGNVTVSDGVDSCTGTVAAGTCSITLTTAGARTLAATYAGDSGFSTSTSAGEPHTVDKVATTTSITSDNPDPSTVGQSVTVNYIVTAAAGTPTGNVTVSDGVDSCTGTVAAGTCNITLTTAGARTLTASYAGDATFNGSDSVTESHTVNQADTTTSITSDSPDPSVVGQSVMVGFTVAAASPGAGTPTGNVTVSDGVDSCTGTVAAGSCNITLTTAGARTLTATYAGDSGFSTSTSAGEPHTVNEKAELTVVKTDDVHGHGLLGRRWTWKLHVANRGTAAATFAAGQHILLDDLPSTNLAYGTVTVSGQSGIGGAGKLTCRIASHNLTCSAQGGPVSIGASTGAFDASFKATPAVVGSYANPRSGGTCQVDPGNQIAETNEANNHCSDRVSVSTTGSGRTTGPPTITLITPGHRHRFTQGQSVKADYRCQDPPGASGIASCIGTVPDGARIDTTTPGEYAFTVTATSRDRQKTTRTIHYIVLPSNHFVFGHIVINTDGTLQLQVTTVGPGDVDALATAPGHQATSARVLLQPARGRFAYARAHRHLKRASTIRITLTPGTQGRRLLARDRAFALALTLAFTPTHGKTRKQTIRGLTVRP